MLPPEALVKAAIRVDWDEVKRTPHEAISGVAVLVIAILAVLIGVALGGAIIGGAVAGGVALASHAPVVFVVLAVVAVVLVACFGWIFSFAGAMQSLDALGINFEGRACYLVLASAPVLAVILGPVAALKGLGRGISKTWIVPMFLLGCALLASSVLGVMMLVRGN